MHKQCVHLDLHHVEAKSAPEDGALDCTDLGAEVLFVGFRGSVGRAPFILPRLSQGCANEATGRSHSSPPSTTDGTVRGANGCNDPTLLVIIEPWLNLSPYPQARERKALPSLN